MKQIRYCRYIQLFKHECRFFVCQNPVSTCSGRCASVRGCSLSRLRLTLGDAIKKVVECVHIYHKRSRVRGQNDVKQPCGLTFSNIHHFTISWLNILQHVHWIFSSFRHSIGKQGHITFGATESIFRLKRQQWAAPVVIGRCQQIWGSAGLGSCRRPTACPLVSASRRGTHWAWLGDLHPRVRTWPSPRLLVSQHHVVSQSSWVRRA